MNQNPRPDVTANLDAERRLRNARAQVVQSHPFFGALLLQQKIVQTRDVETLATNGKQLFFNPDWVLEQEMDHLHFACAHEALHPGLLHHTRRGSREFGVWNHACDYAINPILKDSGFHLPEGVLMRDDLRGLSAEAIYTRLRDEQPPPPPSQEPEPDDAGDDDSEAQGDDGDEGDDQDAPGDAGDDGPPDDDEGDGDDADGPGAPSESQGGQGDAPSVPSYGGAGAVLDAPAPSADDQSREEADWKVLVAQAEAFAAASEAGDLPGDLTRQLRSLLDPRADWRELLRRYMDQFARADYSWQTPNRRFVAGGIYLPSLRSEQLGRVLFVVDASLSMPAEGLTQACSEVQAICSELRPEALDVVVHDTRVRTLQTFEPDEPVELDVVAGGGTHFAPVCEWIREQAEQYAVVIWFTDLEAGDWPEAGDVAPDAPVLWIDYAQIPGARERVTFGDEIVELPR